MQATIEHLDKIVRNYSRRLEAIPETAFVSKPDPQKWSKLEILGHLVDSAQNNIRRFIVAQYEDSPTIVYRQDTWVEITGYQHYPTRDLVDLWSLLNRHICKVLSNISPTGALRKCVMGDEKAHAIEWVAADYCNHLLHHLHQILNMEPIAYP